MLRLAVFVSGRGSNLQAILNAKSSGYLNVDIRAIFTDKSNCGALEIAQKHSIPVWFLSKERQPGSILYEDLVSQLREIGVDLIVLAGFLKQIPDSIIDEYPDKIINIHPALLPSFGGKGMYGMNVHRAVFNSSVKVSGPTVHFVDKIYDNGKIIAQRAVDISDADSPEDIARKVLTVEHELLPFVIKKFDEGKIKKIGDRVIVY
ncbi:MAG: phosphoribosylglycinamide formyltransferase [Ignavibacteriales bacterium]